MKTSFCFLTLAASITSALLSQIPGDDSKIRTQEQLQAIQDDADVNRKCHQANANYIPSLAPGKYAASAFHNCFRTSKQIFEFVDTLTSQNANLISKFPISTTVKGQTIYAYKLSTSAKPKALYYESLIHAREWIA
ncbi:hypothetical protein As57867_006131, partial [Aphanomyces stellatus]